MKVSISQVKNLEQIFAEKDDQKTKGEAHEWRKAFDEFFHSYLKDKDWSEVYKMNFRARKQLSHTSNHRRLLPC